MILNLDSTAQTLSGAEREQRERVSERERERERDHDTPPLSQGRGENGHAELTAEGLGDALLALFDKMVRGFDEARISSFVADICRGSHKRRPRAPQEPFCPRFSDALVPRGKGERKIFDHLLVVLYERYAAVLVDLVELIPTHGSWRDLLNLLLECNHGNVDYPIGVTRCVEHVCTPVEGRHGGARCSNVPRA